jgi:transcriptional regulator GlxA family with amidase domain
MPASRTAPTRPFRLGLVLFPGCMPAGLFATQDMLRACNLRAGQVRMTTTWVAAASTQLCTDHSPGLQPEASLADTACDAWLLPGLWLGSAAELGPTIAAHKQTVDALAAGPARTQVWGYCAGVALAAAAGRLDHHDATATWWLMPALRERFPRVQWCSAADPVTDRNAITASGPSGYLPLMLDRLAQLFPAEVLHDVQELLMLPSPRVRHPAFEPVEMMRIADPAIRALLSWAQRTPAQEVTLAQAARQQNVSVRTLCRRIEEATGRAAGEWLRLAKLCQAAEELRMTRAPVKAISDRLGFGSEASLYRAFKSAAGLTPSAYRQAYGNVGRG